MAITAGCGYVPIWSSFIIGIGSGTFSYFFCNYKNKILPENMQDSLDVFGCHGISGIWGCLATGIFASDKINHNSEIKHNGALYGYK